jgi:hypothetical protein
VDKGRPLCMSDNGARHAVSWLLAWVYPGPSDDFFRFWLLFATHLRALSCAWPPWMAVSVGAIDVGMPQIFGSASCTRLLWSPYVSFCIHSIDMNLHISFVWSKTVRKSILVVVCCCPCACHSCWWGLSKVTRFASLFHFFDSWAFGYYMYYTETTNSWNLCQSFCLRTVQCKLWVLVHLRPFYIKYLVVTRLVWSLCDIFWIYSIDINLQIPFVWGELVSESIIGVLC